MTGGQDSHNLARVREVPLLHAGYSQPSIEDYGDIGELTAGDPSSQHLGLGGTMAVASIVVPQGGGGDTTPTGPEGGSLPSGGEGPGAGAGGPVPTAADGGGGAPTGAEGAGSGGGALAFTGFPAAAVGALGAVTAAAGVGLRKALRRHK